MLLYVGKHLDKPHARVDYVRNMLDVGTLHNVECPHHDKGEKQKEYAQEITGIEACFSREFPVRAALLF